MTEKNENSLSFEKNNQSSENKRKDKVAKKDKCKPLTKVYSEL